MKLLKLIALSAIILMATVGASNGAPAAMLAAAPSKPNASYPANGSLVNSYCSSCITFKWSNTGVTYDIQISTDSGFSSVVDQSLGLTTNSYVSPYTYSPQTYYYWHVQAYDASSNASGWSGTFSFRTSLSAPTLLTPANGSTLVNNLNNDITHTPPNPLFSWSSEAYATQYVLQVSASTAFNSMIVNVTLPYTNNYYTPTSDMPVNSGAPLYWRVEALNSTWGPSGWTTWSFTPANPPTVPVLVQPATGKITNDVTPGLSWKGSSLPGGTSFTYYEVQISTDSTFKNLNKLCVDDMPSSLSGAADSKLQYDPGLTTAHLDVGIALANASLPAIGSSCTSTTTTGLGPATTYYWRVRAYGNHGTSDWSTAFELLTSYKQVNATTFHVTPNDGISTPPHLTSNLPTFTWAPVIPHPTYYTIQVSLNPGFSGLLVNTNTGGNTATPHYTMTRQDKPLPPGHVTVYWRVSAGGNTYGQGLWSNARSFTTASPPSAPSLIAPKGLISSYKPTLIWSVSVFPPSSTATFGYYEVEVDTSAVFTAPLVDNKSTTNQYAPFFTLTSALNSSTVYYWRVRACNSVIPAECSGWSATSFSTRLAVPTGLSSSGSHPGTVVLTWSSVPNATYQVQVSNSAGIFGTTSTSTMAPTLTVHLGTGTYFFRVRSVSAEFGGFSSWSAPHSIP